MQSLVEFCDQRFAQSAFNDINSQCIEVLGLPWSLKQTGSIDADRIGFMAEEKSSQVNLESRLKGRLVHFKHNKYLYETDLIWGSNV
jgi:hypothetical protein